jgi:hypothetical protein
VCRPRKGAGRSDDASFNAIGVQTSGVASGASQVKTTAQVAKWGGTQSAFDPCYHRACDIFPANVSDTVLDHAGDAAAHTLWTLTTGSAGTVVYSDTFETAAGWTANPNGTDTVTTGGREGGDPEATDSGGAKQLGTTVSGHRHLAAELPVDLRSEAGEQPSHERAVASYDHQPVDVLTGRSFDRGHGPDGHLPQAFPPGRVESGSARLRVYCAA